MNSIHSDRKFAVGSFSDFFLSICDYFNEIKVAVVQNCNKMWKYWIGKQFNELVRVNMKNVDKLGLESASCEYLPSFQCLSAAQVVTYISKNFLKNI